MRGKFLVVLLAAVVLAVFAWCAWADVPPVISYQGRLMDSKGVPVRDGIYDITVWLYSSPTDTSPNWGPVTYRATTLGGLFALTIGDAERPLDAALFRRETFIELAVNEQSISPRARIHCVGYAFRAQEADTALQASDLSLPFSRTVPTSSDLIFLRNSGTGRAGNFEVTSATNASAALRAYSVGLGEAGHFEIGNASSASPSIRGKTSGTGNGALGESSGSGAAVAGTNTGTGKAGDFQISNAANSSAALRGYTTGAGRAGEFQISNSGSNGKAVYATTNGAASGAAIYASNTGLGEGAYVEVNNAANNKPALDVITNGTGVGGMFTVFNASNGSPALQATTSGSGPALRTDSNSGRSIDSVGRGPNPTIYAIASGTGPAGHFETTNYNSGATALEVTSNGSGPSIFSRNTGYGESGHFEITNSNNGSSAIYAATNGKSPTLNVSTSGTNEVIHAEVTNASSGSSAIYAKTLGSAPTINAQAGTGKAGYFAGDVEVTGKVKAGSFEGGMVPVAFGTVYSDGTRRSGTTNWTCTYHEGYYKLQVNGVNTDNAQVLVTPRLAPGCYTSIDTTMGYVIVSISAQPHMFDFVIYKN